MKTRSAHRQVVVRQTKPPEERIARSAHSVSVERRIEAASLALLCCAGSIFALSVWACPQILGYVVIAAVGLVLVRLMLRRAK